MRRKQGKYDAVMVENFYEINLNKTVETEGDKGRIYNGNIQDKDESNFAG